MNDPSHVPPASGPDAAAARAPDIGPEWRAGMRGKVSEAAMFHLTPSTMLALLDRIDALEDRVAAHADRGRRIMELERSNALLRAVADAITIDIREEYPLLHALGEARDGGAL